MIWNTSNGPIYYEHYTTQIKDAPTAVYLHGLGGDCRAWDFMKSPTLNTGYNFLTLDLPGHGLSYRPDNNFNFTQFFTAIDTLLNKQEIKRYILVGHCLGGIVALHYVYSAKTKPESMILLNSSDSISSLVKILAKIKIVTNIIPDFRYKNHIKHFKYISTGDLNIKRLFSDVSHVGLRSYLRLLASLTYVFSTHDLSIIKIPTLVIGGKYDKIFPLDNQKYIYDKLGKASLKIIDTNHVSVLNAQDKVCKIILNWLSKDW